FQLRLRKHSTQPFDAVLLTLIALGPSMLVVGAALLDEEFAKRAYAVIAPIGFFSGFAPMRAVNGFSLALVECSEGRLGGARAHLQRALVDARSRLSRRLMSEEACAQLEAAILAVLGALDVYRSDD